MAATAVWNEMQASNTPERARAVAELIADDAPDLVGLQEVSTWRSAPAEVGGPAGFYPTGPFVTDYEVLDLLLEDLAELGTSYEVVKATLWRARSGGRVRARRQDADIFVHALGQARRRATPRG